MRPLTVTVLHGATTDIAGPATGSQVQLFAGVPNPFSASTRIAFLLPTAGVADVDVFDATGRLIRTLSRSLVPAGRHELTWDGADSGGHAVRQGLYYVRLQIGSTVRSVAIVRLH